jgi:glyoxylase-like metal-dependent hydrolase (beta-lactamase superfamily II)
MSARFEIGRFSCAVIEQGPSEPYPAAALCANVGPEEAAAVLGGAEMALGMNSLLVRTGREVLLIDTGIGALAPGALERLHKRLGEEGIAPEDVALVLTSHAHPDHIGGHLTDGKPTFPRAKYLFSKVEWDTFVVNGTGVEMFDQAAQALLSPLEKAGVVELLGSGEILPGIEVIEAPGHTPGHILFALADEGKRAIYAADTFLFAKHAERPEIFSGFDLDGPGSVETRRRVFRRASDDRALLVVYHLDGPGVGRVEAAGKAWRWVAGIS